MGRNQRYVPSDGDIQVVEVMNRCVRGIFLLRPSKVLCERIEGILGRAQRLTGVEIYSYDFQSNHFHMELGVRDAGQLADFMMRVGGQISVELRKLLGWHGPVWQGRYKHSILEQDPKNLASRFRYITAQGCEAGLVASPRQWPGASSAKALCKGEMTVEGVWIDRQAMDRAKSTKKGQNLTESDFAVKETVVLSKLRGWGDLSDDQWCQWVRDMVGDIEERTRQRHNEEGTRPLGVSKILKASPTRMPKTVAWGPRPRIIARSSKAFEEIFAACKIVFDAYAEASAQFRAGRYDVEFPPGTFPPHGPYHGIQAQRAGP